MRMPRFNFFFKFRVLDLEADYLACLSVLLTTALTQLISHPLPSAAETKPVRRESCHDN